MHELALLAAPGLLGLWVTAKAWAGWRWRRRGLPGAPGEPAPAFGPLPGTDGATYTLGSFRGARALVVVFMANRCPGVKAYDERLVSLERRFRARGVRFVGVNPIDASLYPSESLGEMAAAVRERSIPFPYLKDPDQGTARSFGAVCTPHVFVLDRDQRIRYRGRIDDAFLAARVERRYLEDVLEDLLAGREPRVHETAPLGCAIDWTSGARWAESPAPRPTGPSAVAA